ncbi:unnamed protein product [Cylindrotheca closterium]|uniref:Uncharacterized protein n=1 Tax=Cylindrotheca closterium TaxID=2856 RepID=A0AAD2FWJ6_9STRA|nr:unnamed protein product [Cylindrotheca closterium]
MCRVCGKSVVIGQGFKFFYVRICVIFHPIRGLINELYTVGPNFKAANNFLWPFKLSNPSGGFSSKTKLLHFLEGGEAGARGEEINKLVKKMI